MGLGDFCVPEEANQQRIAFSSLPGQGRTTAAASLSQPQQQRVEEP
jgi:hypothetical protein